MERESVRRRRRSLEYIMTKWNVLCPTCCVLAALLFLGQVKKVTLKDGTTFRGKVTETKNTYQIELRPGASVTVAKADVASVEDATTPAEEYRRRLAKIDPKDADERVKLGRWALDRGLLEIARKELTAALALEKNHEVASLLLRQVEARIAARRPQTRPTDAKGPDKGPIAVGGAPIAPEWLVTEDEIYRIRLEELRRTDRVRVRFRNNLINRFIEMMRGRGDFRIPGHADRFRGWPPVRQALYILDNVDRDDVSFKDDIRIGSDPRFMVDFRSRIWPIVAARCASAECHGGQKPEGKLRLFNVAARNDRIDYTNFLILDSYVSQKGEMINRDRTEASLLLQYGLPPEQAQHRHPKVKSTPPAYTSRNAANYRRVLEWIESLKGPPHPEYRVKLRIPWAPKGQGILLPDAEPGSTQPATQPADDLPI